jgi:hypothetical protein
MKSWERRNEARREQDIFQRTDNDSLDRLQADVANSMNLETPRCLAASVSQYP